jgi:putative two-component system response regulator
MTNAEPSAVASKSTILVAEDDPVNQKLLENTITKLGHYPILVANGQAALDYCVNQLPDLFILDMILPQMNGMEVLKQLRVLGLLERVSVIVISSLDQTKYIAACIRLGAKDYMVKPYDRMLLTARIQACLERKQFHEREKQYYALLEDFNASLERRVQRQVKEITQSHLAAIFAMSKLAESRDADTGDHLERMREYCVVLCKELGKSAKYQAPIDESFINDMYIASPLHDIGKVAIPDAILQKPGKLTDAEWAIMKNHTLIGADTLRKVHKNHPNNNFIRLGIEIAENHHEKWDGSGYPHGQKGEEIPLSARILAVADVYDALTSARCYKPAFSHTDSARTIFEQRGAHFDPDIVDAFHLCGDQFLKIKKQYID